MNISDKKNRLLECIIVEYIKNPEPVGSEHLKELMGLEISSATIRNYLKAMSDDGLLVQFHVSGGRAPSDVALRSYWHQKLDGLESVSIRSIEELKESSDRHNVASMVKLKKENRLKNVYSAGNKYVVAEFEDGEITVRGDSHLAAFLNEFVGLDIQELRKVAVSSQVGELIRKIDDFNKASSEPKMANETAFFEVATANMEWGRSYFRSFVSGDFLGSFANGLYFDTFLPSGYMMFKSGAILENQRAEFVCVGQMSRNFEKFLQEIS
jgi:heat-inducible transcriptional repressor